MGTEYLCECSPQSCHRQIRTRLPVGIVHGLALLPWPAFGTNRVFQTQYDKTRMGCRSRASTMTRSNASKSTSKRNICIRPTDRFRT